MLVECIGQTDACGYDPALHLMRHGVLRVITEDKEELKVLIYHYWSNVLRSCAVQYHVCMCLWTLTSDVCVGW